MEAMTSNIKILPNPPKVSEESEVLPPLIQEALIECQTLQHLTANYYIKGYRPPPAYSMVQAHSKQHKYMGYVSYAVEEAIIDAVDCGRSAVEALNL